MRTFFKRPLRVVAFVLLALVVLPGARCGKEPDQPPQSSAVGNPSTATVVPGSGATVNDSSDFAPTPVTSELLRYIQRERADRDLVAVNWDQTVAGAAVLHTNDMVAQDYFALVSPQGLDVFQRLASSDPPSTATAAQYFIVQGSQDINAVWHFIMENDTTRNIIQGAEWRSVGIGYNPADEGKWTFVFTN
jgi:uncharacterized protein YkwD